MENAVVVVAQYSRRSFDSPGEGEHNEENPSQVFFAQDKKRQRSGYSIILPPPLLARPFRANIRALSVFLSTVRQKQPPNPHVFFSFLLVCSHLANVRKGVTPRPWLPLSCSKVHLSALGSVLKGSTFESIRAPRALSDTGSTGTREKRAVEGIPEGLAARDVGPWWPEAGAQGGAQALAFETLNKQGVGLFFGAW